jgi:2-polyprenyl-3-methyl-5-hydroxy-6-metoxy-1,4-benzoquinol methylase
VPAAYLLDAETEARIYAEHQNSPTDQGYRRFLSRLLNPMLERLQPGAEGLDFGSGPGPTLSQMFAERGFWMQIYDPIYAQETEVLNRTYPFVTCTEVLEHMSFPYQNLKLLWSLVQPGGLLGIMTSLRPEVEAFKTWRYKDDSTHVRFYSRHTMQWLAQRLDAKLEFVAHDVMVFTRIPETRGSQTGDSYV